MVVGEASPFAVFCQKSWRWFVRLLARLARNATFRRAYAWGALAVLLGTTLFWALLGAQLQMHNGDQLSDPYLFSSWQTFHGAIFPGSHTFLLKWPVFWLTSLFGNSTGSLVTATVVLVLLTVGALAAVLHKIDRRPLVFGTVCLGLALALLLIPTQPYAGALLPVNMAMLTTRNIEYAVYLVALVCLARARRFKSRSIIVAVVLLAILIASDKLFLSLGVGGALLALIAYCLARNWSLANFAARWLAASGIAAALAYGLVLLLSGVHLTNFTSSTATSPYGAPTGVKDLALGAAYTVLGIFTNAGANPAYDNRILARWPAEAAHRLWSPSGLAYLAAALGLLYALFLAARLVRPTFAAAPGRAKQAKAHLLALTLIWSTVAAVVVFVGTHHYYAVDARYLTIGFFALAVGLSVELRKKQWRWPEDLLLIACGLLVAIAIAIFHNANITSQQQAALSPLMSRDRLVTQALYQHKVDLLVGDYWRVYPIKHMYKGNLVALPLSNCTEPSGALYSTAWEPDLTKHSFAYLVTLDGSLTDFPNCTLAQVTAAYGQPNASQLIAGSYAKPAEVLLFYDQGAHRPVPGAVQPASQPVLPVTLRDLGNTACDGPTTMNIVAHQDDDLLFLSPDLLHDIQAGHCVRTVFLTAGDSGGGKLYWVGRQLGSEAAYGTMLGGHPAWDQQTIELAAHEYITVATPRGNSKVTLLFFNLPDGDLDGQGFARSGYQSLARLWSGELSTLDTLDGQSNYTSRQLTAALATLMDLYQPAAIHTQADVGSHLYPDHSDHITTGKYAEAAAKLYDQQHFGGGLDVPVVRYIGYPIHGYSRNLYGPELAEKEAAFLAYAKYDGGVCRTRAQCAATPTYGAYLTRQYTEDTVTQ